MKRALVATGIGAAGSVLLLAAPSIVPTESASLWVSRLAYGPGNQLFSWLSEHRQVGSGEMAHHALVLATSLICWWSTGGVVAYLLASRGNHN